MVDLPALPTSAEEVIKSPAWRLEWLKTECQIVERKIELFDDLAFRIKGWAIATWSGVTTVAFTRSDWRIAALSLVVPVLFMLIDASYKRYQICFVERTREIMRVLNDPAELSYSTREHAYVFPIYDLLGIHGRGTEHDPFHQEWGGLQGPLMKASVTLVYLILFAIGLIVTVVLLP